MVKNVFSVMVAAMLFVAVNVSALTCYETMKTDIANFGKSVSTDLESINNIPFIGKLTYLLPFAAMSACFRHCPGQTMFLLAGGLMYMLANNNKFNSMMQKCPWLKKFKKAPVTRSVKKARRFDDSLFIYEDDEEFMEDVEEELFEEELFEEELFEEEVLAEIEEEMLLEELSDEEYYDEYSGYDEYDEYDEYYRSKKDLRFI